MPAKNTPSDDAMELVFRWFIGEVAFVLLPLGIIVAIRAFLGVSINDLLVLPEWSFASIVLLAAGLNKFLELKTRLQRDTSNRIFHGAKFVVLLLIVASVVLAFAVAGQHGVKIDSLALASTQTVILILAATFLFSAMQYELKHESESWELSTELGPPEILDHLMRDLEMAESRLRHIEWALGRQHDPVRIFESEIPSMPSRTGILESLVVTSDRVERLSAAVKTAIADQLSAATSRPRDAQPSLQADT